MHTNQNTDQLVTDYENHLLDEDQTFVEDPCGMTSLAYTGKFIAAMIGSSVRRWMQKVPFPYKIIADVGMFKTSVYWRPGEEWVDEVARASKPIEPPTADLPNGDTITVDTNLASDSENQDIPL